MRKPGDFTLSVVPDSSMVSGDMKNPHPSLYEKLDQLMTYWGHSQSEAARRVGVKPQRISDMMTKKKGISGQILWLLARLLKATVEELMDPTISSGNVLDNVKERRARGDRSYAAIPSEIENLPPPVLEGMASIIRPGGEVMLSAVNYQQAVAKYWAMHDGAIVKEGPDERPIKGRRGSGKIGVA